MSDHELLAAVVQGDDAAFRELFQRHAPWLAGGCGALCQWTWSRTCSRRHSSWFGVARTASKRMASLPLAALRLGHPGGLVLIAVLALAGASSATTLPATWLVLVRNTLGYACLALIAATQLGPAYSWLVPLLYSLIVLVDGSGALWAWPLQPTGNLPAAGGLLVLGLAIVARWDGSRHLGDVIRRRLQSISLRS